MLHRRKFAAIIVDLQRTEDMKPYQLAMLTRIELQRLKRITEGEVSPTLEEASAIVNVFGKQLIID